MHEINKSPKKYLAVDINFMYIGPGIKLSLSSPKAHAALAVKVRGQAVKAWAPAVQNRAPANIAALYVRFNKYYVLFVHITVYMCIILMSYEYNYKRCFQ